jgi:hypothetical protein
MLDTKQRSDAPTSGPGSPAPQSEDLGTLADEILRQSDVAILAGSSLDFAEGVLAKARGKLHPEVLTHLGKLPAGTATKVWVDQSRNALRAATIFGIVATCVARLRHEPTISEDAMNVAFALVKQECNGTFGPQGCWCGCP